MDDGKAIEVMNDICPLAECSRGEDKSSVGGAYVRRGDKHTASHSSLPRAKQEALYLQAITKHDRTLTRSGNIFSLYHL